MKYTLLLALFTFSTLAQAFFGSAVRHEGEDFNEAMMRSTVHKALGYYDPGAVTSVARKYSEYTFPEMEKWSSYTAVKKGHSLVRDLRFLDWDYEGESFMRRSSWLYPDDGCFIRAELMVENLMDNGQPLANKIFVIGNLEVKTPNAMSGSVRWWYHVAPIVKVRSSYYVIDPALKTKKPLRLASWLKLMNKDIKNLKIAICDPRALTPQDNCFNPYHYELDKIVDYQHRFLNAEWMRVFSLGRDPVEELGDNPPWQYMLFGFIPMIR